MLEQLIAEANRQFTLCNACRYCEGLCAVFPAMEMRTGFEQGDVAYLSNVCHDCRACLDVCPFSEPHEYAIDIPQLMSKARVATFGELAVPGVAWRLLRRPWSILVVVAAAFAFYLAVALATGAPGRIVHSHTERDSFYHVVGYLWLLVPMGVLGGAAVVAIVAGVARLVADLPGGTRRFLTSAGAHRHAVVEVLGLRNLKGGGGGCHYPGDRISRARAHLHHAVFYGFGGMFLATISAAVEQDFLGRHPPYGWLSVPVVLGTAGGLATLAGCVGFLVLGVRRRDTRKSGESRALDRAFTTMLVAATATGLLTLVLRTTSLLGPVLIVHLAMVGALFVTMPYGKFVHGFYRYAALVRARIEAGQVDEAAPGPLPAQGVVPMPPVLDPAAREA